MGAPPLLRDRGNSRVVVVVRSSGHNPPTPLPPSMTMTTASSPMTLSRSLNSMTLGGGSIMTTFRTEPGQKTKKVLPEVRFKVDYWAKCSLFMARFL